MTKNRPSFSGSFSSGGISSIRTGKFTPYECPCCQFGKSRRTGRIDHIKGKLNACGGRGIHSTTEISCYITNYVRKFHTMFLIFLLCIRGVMIVVWCGRIANDITKKNCSSPKLVQIHSFSLVVTNRYNNWMSGEETKKVNVPPVTT